MHRLVTSAAAAAPKASALLLIASLLLNHSLLVTSTSVSSSSSSSQSSSSSSSFHSSDVKVRGNDLKILTKLVVLVRHGDRSPYLTFPTNPYPFNDTRHWPDGPDQLTMSGKRRMLDFGRHLRAAYYAFLSNVNPVTQVYARSSPADRCLNTLSLMLAGMFPPDARHKIDWELAWQPLAIHTERDGDERMLTTSTLSPCKLLSAAKNLQKQADDVKRVEQENRQLFDQLSTLTGFTVSQLSDIDRIYDPLITAKQEGKMMPPWLTDQLMDRLRKLDDKTFCVASSTKLIQKLDSGPWLHEMKQRLPHDGQRSVFLYATHDSRMPSFLRIMNGYDGGATPYGSAILIEDWLRLETGQHLIQVFHVNDTWSHEAVQLQPPGCSRYKWECSLQEFLQGFDGIAMDEREYEDACRQPLPSLPEETGCFA